MRRIGGWIVTGGVALALALAGACGGGGAGAGGGADASAGAGGEAGAEAGADSAGDGETGAAASCGGPGAACASDAECCSASCGEGVCRGVHVATLDENRDRLLDTLAQIAKAADRCAGWSGLDDVQKGIFLTHTDMLGNRVCTENTSITSGALDGNGNCDAASNPCQCPAGADMALDHVFELWTVNGNDPSCSCTETSTGYHCCNGGGEWHRIFFTADDTLIAGLRDVSSALPQFGASGDLAGPHDPFTQSDETSQGSPRGQTHFFAKDADATTLTRTGVAGVLEPHIVELDNDYNVLHDSNPEGCYGFFGLGCSYGRVAYKKSWSATGNQAPTTFRGNGEPSAIPELASDAVYTPTCPTAHLDPVSAPLARGAVVTLTGQGFADCAAHVGCGNEVHVRTHASELVLGEGSPFVVSESATELRFTLPIESGAGKAYVWIVTAGVLSNLAPATVAP